MSTLWVDDPNNDTPREADLQREVLGGMRVVAVTVLIGLLVALGVLTYVAALLIGSAT